MHRKAVWTILGLAAAAALSASPLNYSQRNVAFRAGVLVLDSQRDIASGERLNYSPYVWLNLDSNRNVKPAGWSFFNPNASTRVTPQIANRWAIHNALFGYGAGPSIGENLTKRYGAYWEVTLSQASDAQITSYDLLHLSAYGVVRLNPLEREKLRKFLEGGGVLWVDVVNGATIDEINSIPLAFAISGANLGLPADGDFLHPLLSVPHTVAFDSLGLMQSETILGLRFVDLTASAPDIRTMQAPTEGDSTKLLPVASDARGPVIMVGQVGDGFVVVTSRGVARTLNRSLDDPAAGNLNRAHKAFNPTFDRGADAAAKLATNLAHLTAGHAQIAKGARKNNSSPIDVGAPLLKRFDAELPLTNTVYKPPTIFGGMAIVASGNQIFVYDANPGSDLNRDGNPDDGVPDFGIGANVDLIWSSTVLTGPLSAPACAEIPDAAGAPQQQISVVDGTGRLLIFNAFPPTPGLGTIAPSNTINPPRGTNANAPLAPVYHDGLLFVADEASAGLGGIVGRVWTVDARTGAHLPGTWQAGGVLAPSFQRPAVSPVVGYIPVADGSGAVDRVLYVGSHANALAGQSASISSLWLGVKGEKPTSFAEGAGQVTVITRAAGSSLPIFYPGAGHPLGIKLTVMDANGDTLTAAAMNAIFDGTIIQNNGVLTFNKKAGQNLPAGATLRLDYTIDWGTGQPGPTAQLLRGQLNLPDDGSRERKILHNMALSPQGTLHLVHGFKPAPNDFIATHQGGGFYSFREEGRGAFKLLNRYELYPQHTVVLNQAPQATIRETLTDNDELQQIPMASPFLSGNFGRLNFQGGPAIHNGVVYVTARGFKAPFQVPCTIVMAFQADPDIPAINVGDISGSFTVLQPDFARSINKTSPEQFTILQSNQFVYERQPGADRGTIRLDNLMSSTRGPVQNAISRSQPIIIRRSNQPDQLIEPNATGSKWTPLLWYAVLHGIANDSPPTVTGETAFFAGTSVLPSILRGDPFPWNPTGLLTGLDSDISPTDSFLVSDPSRPWLKQLWQLKIVSPPNDIRPNPAIRWPQSAGVTNFLQWAVRLLQTTLGASPNAFGVVAGDGVLLSWSSQGLWGFSRSDFLVADEGRLARFDPGGNPVWASDASLSTGSALDIGSAANVKPLVRPTRAYPVAANEMIVADPGANRVVRLDTAGRELRSINQIRLDPNFVPDGFEANAPLRLTAPRDVLTFTSYQVNQTTFSNPSPTGLELWVHHVIADSGNKRIVEIVDRYRANATTRRNEGLITDASGEKALGVLLWHSPSSFSGKNFNYTSLARVYVDAGVNSRWVYAAGIGSALPTRVDTGLDSPAPNLPREAEGGNGGIVIFDWANSQVINEVTVPGSGANVFYNPATGAFDAPARPQRQKLLGNLSSVSMRNVLHPTFGSRVAIMFTDAEGVFEILQPTSGGAWVANWMLPREVYKVMRHQFMTNNVSNLNPRDLRAYYARRLDSGEVLIVNGYYGQRLDGSSFTGEVIQVDGDLDAPGGTGQFGFDFNKQNLGFWTFSVRFELPPVVGSRGLVIPVFADRR
jgi:hypothetical protein